MAGTGCTAGALAVTWTYAVLFAPAATRGERLYFGVLSVMPPDEPDPATARAVRELVPWYRRRAIERQAREFVTRHAALAERLNADAAAFARHCPHC
jgi:hypothetical protein